MSNNKIYVGNLSFNTTEENLKTEFSKYGEISEVRIITDRDTNRSKGFAFVTFSTSEAMNAALEKNGQELDGRALRVNVAEDRKPSTDRGGYKGNSRGGNSGGFGGNRRF